MGLIWIVFGDSKYPVRNWKVVKSPQVQIVGSVVASLVLGQSINS